MKIFGNTIAWILLIIIMLSMAIFTIGAFAGVPVALIFMILKLCNVITWNWFLVIGIPLLAGFGCMLLAIFENLTLRYYEILE